MDHEIVGDDDGIQAVRTELQQGPHSTGEASKRLNGDAQTYLTDRQFCR